MSTGTVLRVRAGMKPIATVPHALRSVDVETGEATGAHHQRSDVCAVPAAGVVAEAMVALVLADAALEILTTPPPALTGRALLDEDFLRERGWTDFARYRCDPDHEPPRVMPSAIPKVGLVPGA